jgi:hypothetical protein
MTTRDYKAKFYAVRSIAVICAIGAIGLLAPAAQAAPSALPPRPTPPVSPALPPRPEPVPDAHSTSAPAPTGGYIELDVQMGEAWAEGGVPWQALWTVVQWQDRLGNWHDVEGWQGTPDRADSEECKKVWWVARADLGKGPFRWVVYQRRGAKLLAQSESFDLPHVVGETVSVGISLAQ